MRITLNIEKKYVFLIIGLFLILGAILLVYAYTYSSIPNPGHGADRVWVNVSGSEMTLQDAIDQDRFGGSAGAIIVNESSCHDVIFGDAGTWRRSHTGGNFGNVYRWVDCPIGEVMVSSGFAGQSSGVDDERTHATCCEIS